MAYGRSVESVFVLGQVLAECKKRLPHGQWGAAVALYPFSETTAKRYMRVASNQALKSAQWAVLPASVHALDSLTQLPAAKLETFIADGTVTANTTLEEAKRLVIDHREWLEHTRRVAEGMAVTPEERAVRDRAYDAATSIGWEDRHQAGREAVLAYRQGGEDAAAAVIAAYAPEPEPEPAKTEPEPAAKTPEDTPPPKKGKPADEHQAEDEERTAGPFLAWLTEQGAHAWADWVASELDELRAEVAALTAERDELRGKLTAAQAKLAAGSVYALEAELRQAMEQIGRLRGAKAKAS